MTLHYFNPWHDEALAARDAHCQPPLAARRLAADLAGLPLWWAQPGDLIVVWDTPPADSGETGRLTENPVTATETPERPTGKTVSRPAARPRPDVGPPRPMVSRVFLTDEGLPAFSSLTPLDGCTAAARTLGPEARTLFNQETRCTDLYTLAYPQLKQSVPGSECLAGPVML